MSTDFEYKPGMFGKIKDLVRKANEHSDSSWEKRVNDCWLTASNEDQTQVWIDSNLYHNIEMLNLKCSKPVPTKHIVNAILMMFLEEHKLEIQKTKKGL